MSGFGRHTPNGLVAKVASVRRLPSGSLDVTTTHAPLNQVLPPGDHHVVKSMTSKVAARAATGPKPFSVTGSCPNSSLRNIHLDGSYSLDGSLDVDLDTSLFGVQRMSVAFTYGDDVDLRLLLDGALNCKASMLVATVKVPFMVGPVPFVASLDLTADGALKADGQLVLHGQQHLAATTGFNWTPSGGMQPIGSMTNAAHLDDPSFTGTAGLEVGLSAGVGLSVAEVVKAHLDARGYIGAQVNRAWTPWWSTYAGVQVNAGMWIVFVGDVAKWTIYDKRWDLDSAVGIPDQTLPQAVSGRAFQYNVKAVGGHAPYTFALATGSSLPTGLSLSSQGSIAGMPGNIAGCQKTTFTVLVTDAQTKSSSRTLSLPLCNYVPPTIDRTSFSVSIGEPLDVTLSARGDHGPFQWSSGTLPAGYQLTSAGHLTAPGVALSRTFAVTVTDSVGASTAATIHVNAYDPDPPDLCTLKPWNC